MLSSPPPDAWPLRRGAMIYPQPVAFACGRMLRVTTPQERIDSALKAAEVLCRYLAALAMASIKGRENAELPDSIQPLAGDLAFGTFLSVIQSVAKLEGHPLYLYFSPFRPRGKGRNREPGRADQHLTTLLELRNELGHNLEALHDARANTILLQRQPEVLLISALQALDGLLGLPLFVLSNLRLIKRQIVAQRLLFMGESPDPIPDILYLLEPLEENIPYVAFNDVAFALPPMVIFSLIEQRYAYRLALLDGIEDDKLRFKTLTSSVLHQNGDAHTELMTIFAGRLWTPEPVRLADGSTMPRHWSQMKRVREAAGMLSEGHIPWQSFSEDTVAWYASRLPPDEISSPIIKIVEHLLDGRTIGLTEDEIRQLILLFGTAQDVRRILRRDMSDIRTVSDPDRRWDTRVCGCNNILDTLITTVGIVAEHIGLDSANNDLAQIDGSADYIALREALVNMFIHQDYLDPSAAAQIILSPDQAVFFNVGYSLIPEERLTVGDRSQARNPIIARALRLINFAELAGSGIQALQRAWRKARRRPTLVESDTTNNSFTLTLDWRTVPNAYDEIWRSRIGVELKEDQALLLNLATDVAGVTAQQAAAGSGKSIAETQEIYRYLSVQMLVREEAGRYHLQPHLRGVLEAATDPLLQLFARYQEAVGKIEHPNLEAVAAGFKYCYERQEYGIIVEVAAKIPERIIQEEPTLLMYYDVATLRLEE